MAHANQNICEPDRSQGKSDPPCLEDQLYVAFSHSYSPDYRVMTARNYARLSLETVLAGHGELASRCMGYLAEQRLQELHRAIDPDHDPAPQHPALALVASLAIALNRYLSGCRDPHEISWARRRRNELEAAFLIPLSEMTAGEARLHRKHGAQDGADASSGPSESPRRAPAIDYPRYLRLTTPISCSTPEARTLVDFQSGMSSEEVFNCFRFLAKDDEQLLNDLEFYWEQVERLAGPDAGGQCLTDLYLGAQKDDGTPLGLLFRCLLIIPFADLFRAGLFERTAPRPARHASELDRLLAQASA